MKIHPGALLVTLTSVALATLASCAALRDQTPQLLLPGTEACVRSSNVSGWQVLDDSNLLIEAPMAKDRYLVRLFSPAASGLDFEMSLGFEDGDRNDQLCSNGDYLVVRGTIPQRIPIIAVRKVTAAEVKGLKAEIAQARLAAKNK